eukprot:5105820-Amphidinium_carterae.1
MDMALVHKSAEETGRWPKAIREMLYLQLPKEGAREAGERWPADLLPQTRCPRVEGTVYRPWRSAGLDETFDLAYETEQTTAGAAGVPQAGIFLDCSKCYKRIPLQKLEAFALESGNPWYALYAALDMRSGRQRVFIQGAVSHSASATHGMPPGCGHAVDLLHAFLLKTSPSLLPKATTLQETSAMVTGRFAKYSMGLHGAEVGGMPASHMNDVRISARKALGKGANRAHGLWWTGP